MSALHIFTAHSLTKEEAIYRMKRLLDDIGIKFSDEFSDIHEDWQANIDRFTLLARGKQLAGTIEVEDWKVLITLEYPPADEALAHHVEAHLHTMAETLLR